MGITIIAAFDEQRGIGKDNSIPWRLPEDMRRFKDVTTGQVCIMGRKTWESIPQKFRPLPGRANYVVSKTYFQDAKTFYESFSPQREAPVWGAFSIQESFNLAKNYYPQREVYICGGAQIYQQALELGVKRMLISKVKGTFDCDTFFPEFKEEDWSCTSIETFDKFEVVEMTR